MYSDKAIKEFPDPDRKFYFTDADYKAGIKRIHIKRLDFDKLHRIGSSASNGKVIKKFGIIPEKIRMGNTKSSGFKPAKPVNIEGVSYESLADANRRLNVSMPTITRRIKSDKYPDWRYDDEDSVDI